MRAMDENATFRHTTVLLNEAVDGVLSRPDGTYVDGTFGRGGHSRLLLERLAPQGRLIGIDRDPEAVAAAAAITDPRFRIVHSGFADMADALASLGVHEVDGVLLDLGVSSPQIDNPERGFSFRFGGPLDMRMDTTRGESAADFLARADEREIAQVIRDYGEERFAGQIAKALVARREAGAPLARTDELRELVARTVKTREPGQDPATRTFQALRIHVNRELEQLEQGLSAALRLLRAGGRLAVISFHSLEDRITKQFIAERAKAPPASRRSPVVADFVPRLRDVGGAIKADEAEVAANPRARSAVLRVAEKLAVAGEGA